MTEHRSKILNKNTKVKLRIKKKYQDMKKYEKIIVLFLVFVLLLGGCSVGTDTRRSTSEKENKTENSFKGSLGGETIRVLSGSEN